MARVLFQRAKGGYRTVRGEVIRQVQIALEAARAEPGVIDGVYGSDTESAIERWQEANRQPPTGKVTDDVWTGCVRKPIPPIFDRCLQLTGDFEGHGFQKVAGNFDDAWLTWGIIGFTLKHGELGAILTRIRLEHPALLEQAFGPLRGALVAMLEAAPDAQRRWADGISLGSRRYRVEPEWEAAFARLGSFPEVQALQLERVGKYWRAALRDAERFGLTTEAGLALCFDVAVQNGGVDDVEARRIRRWLEENPGASQRDRRVRIADVVAENSNPRWVLDVRKRKRAIATGEGEVHEVRYAIGDWGLGDFAWR